MLRMAPPRKDDNAPPPTPLAAWLDSIIPAVFASDAALANAVGVDRSLVGKWRRGMTPKVAALVRLADAAGTDIGVLMRIAGYQPEGSRP